MEELERDKGVRVKALAFDLTDIGSVERLVKDVIEDAGSIDAFVHCSRILPSGGTGRAWDQDPIQLTQNVQVNSAASLYLIHLVGEQMITQKRGSMVVFGSMMGLIGVEKHNYDGNPSMVGALTGMLMQWINPV